LKLQAAILLVEDDNADSRLVVDLLRRAPRAIRVFRACDGDEALTFLRQANGYSRPQRPDLILLDLNLPKKHGFELLEELKQDGLLKSIPVVILTSSDNPDDVRRAYDLHASCYINKPFDLSSVEHVMSALEKFWFEDATLPVN
jgi:chemotaxis family two-component system response regulator Rcp1